MKVYVASSWMNTYQPDVVALLRTVGHEVYDFRNPVDGDNGFSWSEIDPNWLAWTVHEYHDALSHPLATDGFDKDFAAMKWADVCVLVLPCGRSAHLEAGWFVGAGKPVLIVIVNPIEPELMYKMANRVCCHPDDVCRILRKIEQEIAAKEDSE